MPSPEQILNGLALAANNFYIVSIIWHLLVLLFFIVLFSGRKLSNKQVMAFLTLPLLTTALFALMISNPFNGIVFSVITIILWFTIYNTPGELVALKWDAISFAGLAFILFGLFYPHFLEGKPHER